MKSLVNDKPPAKQSINASAFHVSTISVIHDCRSRLYQICYITVQKYLTSRANTIIMLRTTLRAVALRPFQQTVRLSSTASNPESSQHKAETSEQKKGQDQEKPAPKKKTMAELDEELRLKMSGLAGDGGEAGVELEGGQVCSTNGCIPEFMLLTHCPARLDEEECQREHVSLYLILSAGKKKRYDNLYPQRLDLHTAQRCDFADTKHAGRLSSSHIFFAVTLSTIIWKRLNP